jgi:uncharacterized alkaline shock family protein YloU
MKLLHAILSRLLMIALIAASVLGMLVTFPLESRWFDPIRKLGEWLVARVLPQPHMLFWFWFGLFWALVALGALASALRRRTEGVTVAIDDGRVVILESALRKYLRATLRQVNELELRKIDIYQMRRRLYVDLYVMTTTGARVPEIENQIISLVKQALREQLGIQQEAIVQIYVTDFTNGPTRDDLVYRPNWNDEADERNAHSRDESFAVADLEPESVALRWEDAEPELKSPKAADKEPSTDEESQATPKKRRGFWSLFGGKSSDESAEAVQSPTSEGQERASTEKSTGAGSTSEEKNG